MKNTITLEPLHPSTAVTKTHLWIVVGVLSLSLFGVFGYAYWRITILEQHLVALSRDLDSTKSELSVTTNTFSNALSDLHSQTAGISQSLTSTKEQVALASDTLNAVKGQVGGVEESIGSISGTVSTLKKLSTIDAELLKKYSKVYFLNENYAPAHLEMIPQDYVYSNTKQEVYVSEALPFLLRMLNQAKTDGVTFYVESAYRSFGEQQSLKSQYRVIYGAGTANSFSADQGYSEHQLGTAVDFIVSGFQGQLTDAFAGTDAYTWLSQNAYKFGFEMSYPKTNTYYIYEPWHWRFVGVKLATYLHDNSYNFYDVDQRTIDSYLPDLFD